MMSRARILAPVRERTQGWKIGARGRGRSRRNMRGHLGNLNRFAPRATTEFFQARVQLQFSKIDDGGD
jgi:hypothetical protein